MARLVEAMGTPGAKLIVSGERRMGKTSALVVALARHRETGGLGMLADFSTASTPVDLGNRILSAATRELHLRWQERLIPWVFILPALLLLTVYLVYPPIGTFIASFTDGTWSVDQ